MNVLIATINIYRAARSRVRRNATRLFTRVLQLSTHCFTRETEKEIERKRERNREKGKNGEQKKKKFHDDFLWSLSSNQRWPRVDTLSDFPRLIFNSQAKANIRSIRRIGQQSRGSLLDYDPFWMEGEGTDMDEFLQGRRACRVARELHEGNWREHRNYCRRRCNNIQPIVSGRVAGTRDLLFARQDR